MRDECGSFDYLGARRQAVDPVTDIGRQTCGSPIRDPMVGGIERINNLINPAVIRFLRREHRAPLGGADAVAALHPMQDRRYRAGSARHWRSGRRRRRPDPRTRASCSPSLAAEQPPAGSGPGRRGNATRQRLRSPSRASPRVPWRPPGTRGCPPAGQPPRGRCRRIHLQQAVRDAVAGVAFARDPQGPIGRDGDAFRVVVAGAALDRQRVGDHRRALRDIDAENVALAVVRVPHSEQRSCASGSRSCRRARTRGSAGPGYRPRGSAGSGLAAFELVNHHRRAHAETREIRLARGDQQVALRDGQQPFRPQWRGQKLLELGRPSRSSL